MTDLVALEQKVNSLQQDVGKINFLVTRFDQIIDKLSVVSQDISRLLAVQNTKLEVQERLGDSLVNLIEKRKVDTDTDIDKLNRKIDANEREIMGEIDKLSTKMDKQNDEMKQHLTNIQKWIYIVTGGGAIVGFLISQILPKMF